MNNQLYQLPVQMPMQEDVNVETHLKGSKPIPFGWEMSNVVLQSFIPLPGKKIIIFFFLKGKKKIFKLFRASEVLPVVLAPNCYAKDKLQGIEALNAKSDGNAAAVRFGFVRIGLSSPDGAWTFGKLLYTKVKYSVISCSILLA